MDKILVIGAGASGLFCASLLAQKGFNVTVFDKGKRVGRKILISGGGHCNFTNLDCDSHHYISQNRHFCKSALNRFTPTDFVTFIKKYNIHYYEKTAGQLFCNETAHDIVDMLKSRCDNNGVNFRVNSEIIEILSDSDKRFIVKTDQGNEVFDKVIVATGGLSYPKLGATPIGYRIAEQFHHSIIPVRAGLVPFTLAESLLSKLAVLSGISLKIEVSSQSMTFIDDCLFTHRGLSGPAMLQISNYWTKNEPLKINLVPDVDISEYVMKQKQTGAKVQLKNTLKQLLPKKLVDVFFDIYDINDINIQQMSKQKLNEVHSLFHQWIVTPNGTEGYRTAEVTLGGVNTDEISSKTMESKRQNNLYFIGEVLDVTGWLGGYNLQWAWSSAYACASEMEFNP